MDCAPCAFNNIDFLPIKKKKNCEKHFLNSVTKYSVKLLSNWTMLHEQFPSLFTYQVSMICFLLIRLSIVIIF
jgi:hypothetical protein